MTRIIEISKALGTLNAPPSKSVAHRLLIGAAMCPGQRSVISGLPSCEDVLATIDCLMAFGVNISYDGKKAVVDGIDFNNAKAKKHLMCRESGSTLRFLIPLALLTGEEVILRGTKKLISRPQNVYEEIAKENGFVFCKTQDSITVKGRLNAGEYSIRGDVSSQFITGLIFALSSLNDNSKIKLTTKIESRSYIELTRSALAEFGISIEWEDPFTLSIHGTGHRKSKNLSVEGDWSSTAFIEAFNYIGGNVKVVGLNENSLQGDRAYREYFFALDKGFAEINIENSPDLGPILFTLAAIKHGGRFIGTKRLKIKESDRVLAMQEELNKFGAELIIEENSVEVKKKELHAPEDALLSHNDHRIVMSLAVICTLYGGSIIGCEAVSKSYPDFFSDIQKLGITTYEI